MKISSLILLGFFLILVMFSITTYMNYKLSEKIDENSDRFERSSRTIRHNNRFQRNLLNMVSGLRGYLLTNESFFIQSYDSAVIENEEILKELSILVESPTQKQALNDIQQLNQQWVEEFATPLVEAKRKSTLSDSSATSFAKLYRARQSGGLENSIQQRLQRKFREFTNAEYAFREQQRKTLQASIAQTRSITFYLTAISIFLGIGIAVFLANHISSGIVKMVKMANTIADGNHVVSIRTNAGDELSRLAHSLNNMAKVLAENFALLKSKNEELNQFAHIVSHDIKAPLRGIDNVVTWIEEDHDLEMSSKVKEYLQLIKGRVVRAENLLNGILSYSRIGREVQHKEVVFVNDLLEEIREYLPVKPGINLYIYDRFPDLFTERLPLYQVFSNLIGNAFKYHDKKNGFVKVYYKEREKYYEFYVDDDGPGIAPIYHEKIFMIFQTLKERDSFESTGVGLAIVKKILDDRKLSITVRSSPGKGSTFMFTWPRNDA